MAIKEIFKVNRKTFFNPGEWVGIDQIEGTTRTIKSIVLGLFKMPEISAENAETFSAAIERLKLSDDDIQRTGQTYLGFSVFFLLLGVFAFVFGFYLLIIHKTFSGLLLAIATSAVLLSQSFKFNFWFFQIKHRKLGCTFKEWWKGSINSHPSTKS